MSSRENHNFVKAIENKYKSRSFYIRSRMHEQLKESAHFQVSNLEFFETHAFALFKPDAIKRGLVLEMIRWLSNKGYAVKLVDMVSNPQEWQFEQLYKFNLTVNNENNQLGRWWLNRRIYTLGPSISLLLEYKDDPRATYSQLKKHKGSSDPSDFNPGELRSDFRATSTTMNLFHCADDPFSSYREFLIFNNSEILSASSPDSIRIKLEQFSLCLNGNMLPTGLNIDVHKIIFHVAEQLLSRIGYRNEGSILLRLTKASTYCGQIEAIISTFSGLQAFLGTAEVKTDKKVEFMMLKDLSKFPNIDPIHFDNLMARIKVAGICLDKFEELALTSTCQDYVLKANFITP